MCDRQNFALEKSIKLPEPLPSLQFGIPLSQTMGRDPETGLIELPRVVVDAVEFLRSDKSLLESEGLFRRSASAGVLKCVVEAYDRGKLRLM